MAERLNLAVDEGVGDMLTALAGGERKRGAYLSDLIKGMAQTQGTPGIDIHLLFNAVRGLTSQMAGADGRLAMLESEVQRLTSQVAVLIAERG
jgi:hypothetical protein